MPSTSLMGPGIAQQAQRDLRATPAEANALRSNVSIATALEECADLLEAQGASVHRVRAYRTAAANVRSHPVNVVTLALTQGPAGLFTIYGVGENIAAAIVQLARTGRWPMLERLRGELTPEPQLMRVPGIGKRLAERIQHELGIETLEELEVAAYDGTLDALSGIGPRRIAAVRHAVASLLAKRRSSKEPAAARPSVAALLELDARYRERASNNELYRIAPRRFNPARRAWLPVMHDAAEGFHVHVLYSNTALAHRLGKTDDWVVIYHERDHAQGNHTVVTEQRGKLRGLRVVRGREGECAEYYATRSANHEAAPTPPRVVLTDS